MNVSPLAMVEADEIGGDRRLALPAIAHIRRRCRPAASGTAAHCRASRRTDRSRWCRWCWRARAGLAPTRSPRVASDCMFCELVVPFSACSTTDCTLSNRRGDRRVHVAHVAELPLNVGQRRGIVVQRAELVGADRARSRRPTGSGPASAPRHRWKSPPPACSAALSCCRQRSREIGIERKIHCSLLQYDSGVGYAAKNPK